MQDGQFQAVKEEIKDRAGVVDIIGGYVTLKKAGVNFTGLCPFHHEKSPSFVVSPHRQMWHCFGCGEGGDVISFVMKREQLDFIEALRLLADRVGLTLPKFSRQGSDDRDAVLDALDAAARFYHALLGTTHGKTAMAYLTRRGLMPSSIDSFRLGFAPQAWDVLTTALTKKGYSTDILEKAGLVLKNSTGRYYDRFRERIMFPLCDHAGHVVGFTGRVLSNDQPGGKYVNSPQGLVYDKGRLLYGLHFAKDAIRTAGNIVVVEGNMDVVASHQAGVSHVVAVSGTALTPHHIALLKRFTDKVVLCLDTDGAGVRATLRSIDTLLAHGVYPQIIRLPEGIKDPDECVKKDPELWKRAIAQAIPFFDFLFDYYTKNEDISQIAVRSRVAHTLMKSLRNITDPIVQDGWLHALADRLAVTEQVIREVFRTIPLAPAPTPDPVPPPDTDPPVAEPVKKPPTIPKPSTRSERIALQLLSWILQEPWRNTAGTRGDALAYFLGDNSDVYKMTAVYYTQASQNPEIASQAGFEQWVAHAHEQMSERVGILSMYIDAQEAQIAPFSPEEVPRLFDELATLYLKKERERITRLMRTAELAGDHDAIARLSHEYNSLV